MPKALLAVRILNSGTTWMIVKPFIERPKLDTAKIQTSYWHHGIMGGEPQTPPR